MACWWGPASVASSMVRGEPGINDWYLDREGRSGGRGGDDDRPDRGPDTWLDQVTGPAAKRGRRATTSTGQAPARRSGKRAAPARRKLPPNAVASSRDRQLAREVARLHAQSTQSLSYAVVIQRLSDAGWQVSKGELQRVMRVTNTPWGRAKAARPRDVPLPAPPTMTSRIPADPWLLKPGQRVAPVQVPTADQALAREAMRIQASASRTLSYAEVAERMRAAGRRVSKADLKRAIQATGTKWGRPGSVPTRATAADSGRTSAVGPVSPRDSGSRRLPTRPPRSDPTICRSCGTRVTTDGYCRCS